MGLVISGELTSHFHEPIDKEKSAPLLEIRPGSELRPGQRRLRGEDAEFIYLFLNIYMIEVWN